VVTLNNASDYWAKGSRTNGMLIQTLVISLVVR